MTIFGSGNWLRDRIGVDLGTMESGPPMIDYDDRTFRPVDSAARQRPTAHYHQAGELIWAEFSGGDVRHGSIAGTSAADGQLWFAYCMVLAGGDLVTGVCRSV